MAAAHALQLRGRTVEASLPRRRRRLLGYPERSARSRPGARFPGRCLPLQAAAPGLGGERSPRDPAWGGCSAPRAVGGSRVVTGGKAVRGERSLGVAPGPQPPRDSPGSARPEPLPPSLGCLARATPGYEALAPAHCGVATGPSQLTCVRVCGRRSRWTQRPSSWMGLDWAKLLSSASRERSKVPRLAQGTLR